MPYCQCLRLFSNAVFTLISTLLLSSTNALASVNYNDCLLNAAKHADENVTIGALRNRCATTEHTQKPETAVKKTTAQVIADNPAFYPDEY